MRRVIDGESVRDWVEKHMVMLRDGAGDVRANAVEQWFAAVVAVLRAMGEADEPGRSTYYLEWARDMLSANIKHANAPRGHDVN